MQPKSISDSIQFLSGVGPKRAESFRTIGINNIENLLFYFPSKYLDRRKILNAAKVLQHVIGGYDGEITIVATVSSTESINYRHKQIFKVRFEDKSGSFECVWFKGIKYFKTYFKENEYFAISGKPVLTKYGNLQFTHPDFDKFTEDESNDFVSTGKIIPFYSIPKELKSNNLGDIGLRKIIKRAIDEYSEYLNETLPNHIVESNNLLSLITAVRNIHFPENEIFLEDAKVRFKYEELFYIESLVALRKYNFLDRTTGIAFKLRSGR